MSCSERQAQLQRLLEQANIKGNAMHSVFSKKVSFGNPTGSSAGEGNKTDGYCAIHESFGHKTADCRLKKRVEQFKFSILNILFYLSI